MSATEEAKILVVDDSRAQRQLLSQLLREWGYQVVAVRDAEEAWSVLQTQAPPDVCLIDSDMPDVSGLELCRRIRAAQKMSTYLIFVAAKRDTEELIRGLECGADDCICKPCNDVELQVRVKAGMRIMAAQREILSTHAMLKSQAFRDGLTGLWNHTASLELLERELARAERVGTPLSICLVDVDCFKTVNDRFGHLVGDTMLREISSLVQSCVRRCDAVGRYGGDEFLVILPGAGIDAAMSVAERIRCLVVLAAVPSTEEPSITVSLGVHQWQKRESPIEAINRAESALHRAKQYGRNRVEVSDNAAGELVSRTDLTGGLRLLPPRIGKRSAQEMLMQFREEVRHAQIALDR